MTTEQKAQRYDEALERAKECHIDGLSLHQPVKEVIEHIFPELKESEDERIRKSIIAILNNYVDNSNTFKPKMLAWLEKQSEQTNLPQFTFDDVLALQCVMETVKKVQEDKELYEQLQSLHDRVHDVYWLEKQGEDEYIDSDTLIQQRVDALAQIEKQGEQKRAWSKEDELMLNDIITCNERHGYITAENIAWLKSLRPQKQWKPTEEQIKTCKEVYADILSAKGFDLGTVNNELNRLEEQLKKL